MRESAVRAKPTPETERLRDALSGNVHALEALIRPHWETLYCLAYRSAGNADDAEDLAQEAVLKIIQSLPAFRGDCEFGTWVYRVGLNVCLTAKRRKTRPENLEAFPLADSSPGPEAAALSGELREKIRSEIAVLRPAYREAVALRYYAELPYEEIAAILKVSPNAARLRVSRGMERLRHRLRDGFVEERRDGR